MICPRCGNEVWRDEVDVGVGWIYGPYGCPCGWSEWEEYDRTNPAAHDTSDGYRTDQWGGATPTQPPTTGASTPP